MNAGWNGGAAVLIAVGILLGQGLADMSGVSDGAYTVIAGEIMSEPTPTSTASQSSKASVSASTSVSTSVSSTGEDGARCESRAAASADARAGDQRASDYDERTVVSDDGSCSVSARATARATKPSKSGSGE